MSKRSPARAVAFLFACLFAVSACTAGSEAEKLRQAPEITGISHWLNTDPLTLEALRGKVVLVDFWAYSCINCLRTLPYMVAWDKRYRDDGLVIIGVHAPEFDFGKKVANVQKAVAHFGIEYPVAMDNNKATWNAWDNHYWPAKYLVGKKGKVLMHHFGEGHYAETEAAIRQALGLEPAPPVEPMAPASDAALPALPREAERAATAYAPDFGAIGSPEMYFGSRRTRNMANLGGARPGVANYRAPAQLDKNQYALDGRWKIEPDYAELVSGEGVITLQFVARKVHMVASSDKPVTVTVLVDGKPARTLTINESKLYTLYESKVYGEHSLRIEIPEAGLRAFTFTFG